MPRRPRLNGRQMSSDTTRIESHAFNGPGVMQASAPPAKAISAAPLRSIQSACPKACAADAQALETANEGP